VAVPISVFGSSHLLQPNLQERFHQLWAVLFQPPKIADDEAPSQIPGTIPNHLLTAVSLLIPQPKISSQFQPAKPDLRLSLGDTYPPSQISYDVTVTRLVQSLTQHAHPHLMLLTSNATAKTPLTVMGAYFPGPLSNPKGAKREFKLSTPRVLFQLRPQFRVYRWTSPYTSLTNVINIEDDDRLSGAVAASDEYTLNSMKPYRIGDPERKGAGLRIDPETISAALMTNVTPTYSGGAVGYEPVCMNGDDSDMNVDSNWEVSVKIDSFEIFRVNGDMNTNDVTDEARIQSQYTQDATEEKIKGEELVKRIQGFGPSS